MNKRYGVPYMGSKNKLAERITAFLPSAPVLVDLFAGGCAISHAAAESGKWREVWANDLDGRGIELFRDAIDGRYADEKRWISREEFGALKDYDPYVRLCWSFGNTGRQYLYAEEVEPWKRALHYAYVFGDYAPMREIGIPDEPLTPEVVRKNEPRYKEIYVEWYKRTFLPPAMREMDPLADTIRKNDEELRQYLCDALAASGLTRADVDRRLGTNGMAGHYFGRSQWEFPTFEVYEKMRAFMPLPKPYGDLVTPERLQRLQSLQRLQRLQRLQSLQRLQRLQRLQSLRHRFRFYSMDYAALAIPRDAVVYCDIPYRGTADYGMDFDHDRFFRWAEALPNPVYVSEYAAPEGWECVAEFRHVSTLASGASPVTERLFSPRRRSCALRPVVFQPEFAF